VGQLDFENPPGRLSHQVWLLERGSTFTIKNCTGFWKNPERGLASSNGVVLVFSSETGELLTIFQDEGFLTDMRTAAAGAVAAKYLAPHEITCIGIIGAGLQARLQLDYLREVTPCRRVKLWARALDRAAHWKCPAVDIEVAALARASRRERAADRHDHGVSRLAARCGGRKPGTHITAWARRRRQQELSRDSSALRVKGSRRPTACLETPWS